jgi:hypothetical protein
MIPYHKGPRIPKEIYKSNQINLKNYLLTLVSIISFTCINSCCGLFSSGIISIKSLFLSLFLIFIFGKEK